MDGETCDPRPDAGDRYHCPTALRELDLLNWSFLNYNAGTWESSTGFNRLTHRVTIDASATGSAYGGDLVFTSR